jgi:hypothetical protein
MVLGRVEYHESDDKNGLPAWNAAIKQLFLFCSRHRPEALSQELNFY